MMGAYKVIFRADKSADSQNRITWEQGCPLIFDVVQISRHTETGVAFLQAKLRNIGADTVASFKSEIVCRFKDGSTQEFTIEPLDADIPCGGFYEIRPIELPRGDAMFADASVKSTTTESGEWRTSANPARIPEGTRLELSDAALKERTLELEEHGCKMSEFAAPFAVEVHDNWTMCACGQPNAGTEACVECGLYFAKYDKASEDEGRLLLAAQERERANKQKAFEQSKRQKKLRNRGLVIGIPCLIVVVACVCLWFFAVEQPRQEASEAVNEFYYTIDLFASEESKSVDEWRSSQQSHLGNIESIISTHYDHMTDAKKAESLRYLAQYKAVGAIFDDCFNSYTTGARLEKFETNTLDNGGYEIKAVVRTYESHESKSSDSDTLSTWDKYYTVTCNANIEDGTASIAECNYTDSDLVLFL